MAVKNIIFDLGGVLLNLDFQKTFEAFEGLGITDFQQYFQQAYSNPLFARLEMGQCTPDAFYDLFRRETGTGHSNEKIAEAWNAMLLDFRDTTMAYLQTLKADYRLFLLSNTNQIHLEAFRNIYFQQYGHHGFDNYFEKAWYSHELGLRKPDAVCFERVLQVHNLKAGETLFIDDTLPNVQAAEKLGILAHHLKKHEMVEEVLPSIWVP
jgi:putative hydrolase of the HAD superfamily